MPTRPGRPDRHDHHRPGNGGRGCRIADRGGSPLGLRIPEAGRSGNRAGAAAPAPPFQRSRSHRARDDFRFPVRNPTGAACRDNSHVRPRRCRPDLDDLTGMITIVRERRAGGDGSLTAAEAHSGLRVPESGYPLLSASYGDTRRRIHLAELGDGCRRRAKAPAGQIGKAVDRQRWSGQRSGTDQREAADPDPDPDRSLGRSRRDPLSWLMETTAHASSHTGRRPPRAKGGLDRAT